MATQHVRTEHTNTWNYGETDRGFDREVKSALHKGMWIWVKSRPSTTREYPQSYRELGCIRILNGSQVDGYYALDGARFSVFEGDVEVPPPERQKYLNDHKQFKAFRHRAVIGPHAVRDHSLGPFPAHVRGAGGIQHEDALEHPHYRGGARGG